MTERNAGALDPHDSVEASRSKETSDGRLVTDGGRDSPKGDLRITLDRDDVQHLMENGTTVIQKEVGPLTVNIRTHQKLSAVVMLSGRRCDEDPEVLDE